MKKSIIAIICFVSSFSLVVPAFAKETDYSYLEDMSVNELKELRAAIDKLLPPEEQKKDGKAASIELTKDNIETYNTLSSELYKSIYLCSNYMSNPDKYLEDDYNKAKNFIKKFKILS